MRILKKFLKVIGIVLAAAIVGFIGLVVYAYFHPEFGLKEPGAAEQPKTESNTQEPSRKTEAVKPAEKPYVSPTPEIVKVGFPEKTPLNEKVKGTLEFRDGDGDLAKLVFETIDGTHTSVADLKSIGDKGMTYGKFTFSQNTPSPRFAIVRLVLVDRAGHRSKPHLLKYQAGDPVASYDNYNNEQAAQRPVSLRKKIHFFILNGTKTDLETDSSFTSDNDATGNVSPAIAKMFEKTVLPQINGIWDQCGIAFDLGMVKVVRAEKIELASGGLWSSQLYETRDGQPMAVVSAHGTVLEDEALRALGVPKGDSAFFFLGYQLFNLDHNTYPAGASSFRHSVIFRWPYIHFLNKDAGEIVLPKRMFAGFAHELGHSLGLLHPDEEVFIPPVSDEFNLMNKKLSYDVKLMPEQCEVVNIRMSSS